MSKQPPAQQDILIGEYTLGVLEPEQRAGIQALLGRSRQAAQAALRWEDTFLDLLDALPPEKPSPDVLRKVLRTLDLPDAGLDLPDAGPPAAAATSAVSAPALQSLAQPSPEPPVQAYAGETSPKAALETQPRARPQAPAGARRRPWLLATAGFAALAGLMAFTFMPRPPQEPPVTVIELAPTRGAILQAPGQSSTPGWVLTIDAGGNVLLIPKVHTEIQPDISVQLWTYGEALSTPRSLGLIDPNQPVAVPADMMGDIGENQFFEMTAEPEGGSPTGEPSGPVLFIGRLVTFGEPQPQTPAERTDS